MRTIQLRLHLCRSGVTLRANILGFMGSSVRSWTASAAESQLMPVPVSNWGNEREAAIRPKSIAHHRNGNDRTVSSCLAEFRRAPDLAELPELFPRYGGGAVVAPD
jgi:hypothetical protein